MTEAERLAAELDAVPENGADPELIADAAAHLRRLEAECEQLRADAERYRWLVTRQLNGDDEFCISAQDSNQANADGWWALGGDMSKSESDAYLDAAMKETK